MLTLIVPKLKFKSTYLSILVSFVLIGLQSKVSAHPGGTKKSGPLKGCHIQNSDGSFHCHSNSRYPGKTWPSIVEALKEVGETSVDHSAQINSSTDVEPSTLNDHVRSEHETTGEAPPLQAETKKLYDRSEWGQWTDVDGDCRNTRTEILIRDNLGPQIKSHECKIEKGIWNDFYTDAVLSLDNNLEIDHIVSLKEAHDTGGIAWSEAKRNKFYNDPDNLVVTDKSTNSSKGSQTFKTWLPVKKERACSYAVKWFKVKRKYVLSISAAEIKNFNQLNCGFHLSTIDETTESETLDDNSKNEKTANE